MDVAGRRMTGGAGRGGAGRSGAGGVTCTNNQQRAHAEQTSAYLRMLPGPHQRQELLLLLLLQAGVIQWSSNFTKINLHPTKSTSLIRGRVE